MIRHLMTAAALAGIVGAQAFAADVCMRSDERTADQIRFIETELRVAAQQCVGGKNLELPELYTRFLLEKRPYLARSEQPLSQYLKREGSADLLAYLSGVANRVSTQSVNVSQFCARSQLAAEVAVKSANPTVLLSLLPVPYEAPADPCTAG